MIERPQSDSKASICPATGKPKDRRTECEGCDKFYWIVTWNGTWPGCEDIEGVPE